MDMSNHSESRPWAQTVKSLMSKLPYTNYEYLHPELVAAGWTPEEAHFLLQAAEFKLLQAASSTEAA